MRAIIRHTLNDQCIGDALDRYISLRKNIDFKVNGKNIEARSNIGMPTEAVVISYESFRVEVKFKEPITKDNLEISERRVAQHAIQLVSYLASYTEREVSVEYFGKNLPQL